MTSRRASSAEGFFQPGDYEKLIAKQRKGNITTLLEQHGERMEHANRNIDRVFSRILNLENQMQRLDEKLANLQNTSRMQALRQKPALQMQLPKLNLSYRLIPPTIKFYVILNRNWKAAGI